MKTMKFMFPVFFALLVALNQAWSVESLYEGAKQPEVAIELSPFVRASNDFGLSLLNEINPASDQAPVPAKNALFSPLGLASALAMLHQGADGQTAQQLQTVLKLDGSSMDKSQIAEAVRDSTTATMNINDDKTIFKMVNSLLIRNGLQLSESYVKTIQDYFGADVFISGSPNVCDEINQKISEKTDKNIENALKAEPSEIVMLLMNFVFFKGDWMYPFRESGTFRDVFNGANDVQYENVTYMRQIGRYGFVPLYDLQADLIEIPFTGDTIGLYVILPRDPNDDLSDVRTGLNASYIESIIQQLSYRHESTVTLPRLFLDVEYDQMSDLFKAMGLTDAFSPSDAKFTSMSSETPVYLNQILHRTRLALDETRAASSSVSEEDAGLEAMAKPLMFDINHPFFYFIRNKQTGQIVLLGEQHKFEQKK